MKRKDVMGRYYPLPEVWETEDPGPQYWEDLEEEEEEVEEEE